MSNLDNIEDTTKQNIDSFFGVTDKSKKEKEDENENVNYTERVSNLYKKILNREPDLGGLKNYANQLKYGIITEEKLCNILKESDEYKKKFGDSKQNINDIDSKLSDMLKLVYCMMGTNRLDEIKPYIETVLPFVDKFIFIDGGSEDGTVDYLKSINKDNKIDIYIHEWMDRFSEQRNNYLDKLREMNYDGWTLVSDTDEHFPIETLSQLRDLIKESQNGELYSGIKFQVEDVTVDDDDRNKVISRKVNKYWKALMFKFQSTIRYEGEPHETLVGHNIKWKDSELIYQHIRSNLHILTRAVENFFLSNSNRWSEKWGEFKFLCTHNKILNFKDYWTLFEKHNLPKEVEDWITVHKDDNEDSGDSEVRETYILYNEVLPKRKLEKELKSYVKKGEFILSHEVQKNTENVEVPNPQPNIIPPPELRVTPPFSPSPPNFMPFFTNRTTAAPSSPEITYSTFPQGLNRETTKSLYELKERLCEQCGSHKSLISMTLHGHCQQKLDMCKECWLSFSDYIKKKVEEAK